MLRGGGAGIEGAVLAARPLRAADRAAVDPGAAHPDEESPVEARVTRREIAAKSNGGATGGGVLGYADEWSEHAGADVGRGTLRVEREDHDLVGQVAAHRILEQLGLHTGARDGTTIAQR